MWSRTIQHYEDDEVLNMLKCSLKHGLYRKVNSIRACTQTSPHSVLTYCKINGLHSYKVHYTRSYHSYIPFRDNR